MEAGDLVLSVAGRDKNRYYIVLAVDGDYCYICDGKKHKCDKPKKKKIKHVISTGEKSRLVQEKLSENACVTNVQLRREISSYRSLLVPSEFAME